MIQASTLAFVVLAVVSGKSQPNDTIDRCILPPSSLCVVSAFTPAQVKFQQETLAHHNQLRARHCVGGLQLDDNLNKIAQAYADKLAAENKFQHSQNGYGENLYYMGSSVSIFEKVAGEQEQF